LDAWPIAKIHTQMPLSANPTHQFDPDQALLEALAALLSRGDDLAERILDAIPLFNQAIPACRDSRGRSAERSVCPVFILGITGSRFRWLSETKLMSSLGVTMREMMHLERRWLAC